MRNRSESHLVIITDLAKMRETEQFVPDGLKDGDMYCRCCLEYFSLPRNISVEMSIIITKQFRKEHRRCNRDDQKIAKILARNNGA
jgi:hypothetical protein